MITCKIHAPNVLTDRVPVWAVEITGHAGYDRKGRDIVCAAVSALFQSLEHGLKTFCHGYEQVSMTSFRLAVPGDIGEAFLLNFADAMQTLAKQYPQHIEVIKNAEL